ncbi:hypothetical protein [Myroides guanonis]|uniref:Uncharacterized protein n=1 Tax=Myroides guanonis TaxID=1150112 RepID=A0A1I3LLN3_9FLAO|nr:hypothetical protein [Myroides guanonis]SFI85617.1 hypothetical protein SAMN04487893_101385 [Myroides guanonis]
MLRKINTSLTALKSEHEIKTNLTDNASKPLDEFLGKYETVSIDDPMRILDKNTLERKEAVADHGILKLLEGTWYSYNENPKRESSGIHTTIMPSPGTDQNKIPGKFAFDCEEYLEKLHFESVSGGVRNRGGATEQFCGAMKYEQSIKSVSKPKNNAGLFPGIHEENGMYLWMSDVINNPATEDSIKTDRGIHNWNTLSGLEVLINNLYPTTPSGTELLKFKTLLNKHPYLDVPFFNIGTIETPQYVTENNIGTQNVVSIVPPKELKVREGIDGPFFIPDYSISRSGVIPHGSTITLLGNVSNKGGSIVLNGKPDFIKTSALTDKINTILNNQGKLNSENITKLIETASATEISEISKILSATNEHFTDTNIEKETLIAKLKKILEEERINSQWDYDHLAISRTMGSGKNGNNNNLPNTSDLKRPFDLDNPPLPFTSIIDLNSDNDNGENLVYTQRMFLDKLYPYSVRPDFRLRDAIKEQDINRYMHFSLSSKNKTGAQGGILNIPFVNRFVPTVEMNMNMWIEEVTENGKTFLQLQYEQIIFFEFGFGDNGGLTSWPHIQVNTLRKYADLNEKSRALVEEQFINPEKEIFKKKMDEYCKPEANESSKCPYHNSK